MNKQTISAWDYVAHIFRIKLLLNDDIVFICVCSTDSTADCQPCSSLHYRLHQPIVCADGSYALNRKF